jgi:C4-dicarboxylate-specific signal transduction histidine kinase
VGLVATARCDGTGDLAAGMLHELNQPLCAILNYAEACMTMLATSPSPSPLLGEAIDEIGRQAQRAGEVVRRLRELVVRRAAGHTRCDVKALVSETVELMHTAIERHGGQVESALREALPPVYTDGVAIQQLTATLLRAALESMSDLPETQRRVTLSAGRADGHVTISVSDRRGLLTESDFESLFDPLAGNAGFSNGLRLALGRALVESLGGRMWGTPGSGGGVTITFSLPANEE